MKKFVINLERSADRRAHITKEFHAYGVEFEILTAKDKFDLTQHDYEEFADSKSESINWSHPIVPGLLACWISHQTVWQHCLEVDELEAVAIFEDDVSLSEEFNHVFSILESKRDLFDIVFLGRRYADKPFKPLIEVGDGFSLGIVKYQDIGMNGYLINRQAMQHLSKQFPKFRDFPIDDILHAPWLTNLRTYILDPAVVFLQTDFESLINAPMGVQGCRNYECPSTTDDWSKPWQSLSKSTKWKRSLRKRAWYFQNIIKRFSISRL